MIYTDSEIDCFISDAVCCYGDKGYQIWKEMAMGVEKDMDTLIITWDKMFGYVQSLQTWEQESDGSLTGNEDNVITATQKDALISKLQNLCDCGC